MISSFLRAVVHWQAIGPLLRVGARYIFMDQLLGLARLMNPAPLLRYWAIFFLQGDPESKSVLWPIPHSSLPHPTRTRQPFHQSPASGLGSGT